jgi:hypothetical protein
MEALKDIEALIVKHGYSKFIIGLMLFERDLTEEDCYYDYEVWYDDDDAVSFLHDKLSGKSWKEGGE